MKNPKMSCGFKINECDQCVLYDDDILIIDSSDDKMIKSTIKILNSSFDMKYLSLVDVILGATLKRTLDYLSQSYYVNNIIVKV